jgi:uncharacterized protein (TIGR02757 family)
MGAKITSKSLEIILNEAFERHHQKGFIANDPISIPHLFTQKEDIEIMGFLVSILSWGQRVTIIKNAHRLIEIFENKPFQFITQHQDKDLKACLDFVHRTFNDTDLLSIIGFLKDLYLNQGGLEQAFSEGVKPKDLNVKNGINQFRKSFEMSPYFVSRTKKHIAYPDSGSACKRLNMFLRWMVRKDDKGIDFGLWEHIKPSQLICPLDVHVIRQALKLNLLKEEKTSWENAVYLTERLKKFDPIDPVKYDFALFGMGVN